MVQIVDAVAQGSTPCLGISFFFVSCRKLVDPFLSLLLRGVAGRYMFLQ